MQIQDLIGISLGILVLILAVFYIKPKDDPNYWDSFQPHDRQYSSQVINGVDVLIHQDSPLGIPEGDHCVKCDVRMFKDNLYAAHNGLICQKCWDNYAELVTKIIG